MYFHTLRICIKTNGTPSSVGGAWELKSCYVGINLWLGQRAVVGLGSGLAVPADVFVPRAVLICSAASIMISNAPSLSSRLPAYN